MAYVIYPQGKTGVPCPPLFALVPPSCEISGRVGLLSGELLWIPIPDLAVCPGVSKGLGRGEGFACTWSCTSRLPEYVDPGAIFPLRAMDAYPVRRRPGHPDAPVCGPHQCDGDPTLDVSARP